MGTRAVILAAGKGTRLGSLTDSVPKPMVPLSGRPMLEYVMEGLSAAGVDSFVLVVGYLEDVVREFAGDWQRRVAGAAPSVTFVTQRPQLGTGHAVLQVPPELRREPFFLTFGDILVDPLEYRRLLEVARTHAGDNVLTVARVEDPWEGAAVYVDDHGRVSRIIEKPPRGSSTTTFNNVGLFHLQPDVFTLLEQIEPSPRGEIELTAALAALAAQGRLRALEIAGEFVDAGTPERLTYAERWLETLAEQRGV